MPISFWNWIYFGILILCWATFLIIWCIGAIYNIFKAPAIQKQSGRLPSWVFGIILVCAILLLILIGVVLFVSRLPTWNFLTFGIFWLRLLGLFLLITSTAFTLWARSVLGLMWTSSPIIKSGHILHTDDPYRITRHPIYTGLLGMATGSFFIGGHGEWFVGIVEVLIIFQIKIVLEERLLLSIFGEQYVQFKERVPLLIPFTKWNRS